MEVRKIKKEVIRGTSHKEVPLVAFWEICKDGWL